MSETKFTPGPWSVLGGIYIYSGNTYVADVMDSCPEKLRANAHLIAAAPTMYEALENILSEMHIDDYGDWALNTSFDVESIRAALAKARGEV